MKKSLPFSSLQRHIAVFAVVSFMAFGVSCTSKKSSSSDLEHSTGFTIEQCGDTTLVTVMSPWREGITMARYAITTPYQRIACTSATHIGFLCELGLMNRLVGTCCPDRAYNLTSEQRAAVADLGDDMRPNLEAILLAQPDAIVVSTYAEGDAVTAQIASLGIPVLYCNEWTETSPLARAEWIRFFGACFGCQARADSIYAQVAARYNALSEGVEQGKVWIMSGQSFRGTWYVPTGNTYMGCLFRDAGAQYRYMDNPSTASLPLTMEQALQAFSDADVWVGCSARSLAELASLDEKHTWFNAYQTGNVYNFYRRTLPSGANDFWETGVVHPELLLHDMQQILRGDTADLYFSQRLQ